MAETFFSTDHAAPRLFSGFFTGLRQGSALHAAADARRAEVERLNALSDAELAARGLSRDAIPRYVFRDVIGL